MFYAIPVKSVSDISPEGLAKLRSKFNAKSKHCRKDKLGNPILMKLSFDEWLSIWIASGHLHEMGTKRDQYCLSRISDIGHYEEGNVYVNLVLNNAIEAWREITPDDVKINALTIKTGYSRRTVKSMIRRGELFI